MSIALFTLSAQAETVTYTDFVDMQDDLESLNTTMVEQQDLISKLSDDIGLMADRIVYTEELLTQSLELLIKNPDFAGTSSSNGVALTSPTGISTLSATTAPVITTTPSTDIYLIYASTVPTFSSGNTISLYIESQDALNTKWSQIVDFAGTSEVYLAVKRIDSNTISSISNGVKVSF